MKYKQVHVCCSMSIFSHLGTAIHYQDTRKRVIKKAIHIQCLVLLAIPSYSSYLCTEIKRWLLIFLWHLLFPWFNQVDLLYSYFACQHSVCCWCYLSIPHPFKTSQGKGQVILLELHHSLMLGYFDIGYYQPMYSNPESNYF